METVYKYLSERYQKNEPIFLDRLQMEGMKKAENSQQIQMLADSEKVKVFDKGIYYLPKKSIFKSGALLDVEKVISRLYLEDESGRCGYIGGLLLANQIGLTTQMAAVYEIVTNKAVCDYQETRLAKSRLLLCQPRVP